MQKIDSNKIQEHLLKEEKIIWTGKSDIKKIFTIKDIVLIPISCIFLIGTLVWELSSIIMMIDPVGSYQKNASGGLGLGLTLFGIPFVIFWLYVAIGRFKVKKSYKKNTIYVVTDKRVIIIKKNGECEKVIEEYLNKITDVYIFVKSSGNGTLRFGKVNPIKKFYSKSIFIEALLYSFEGIPIFYDIDDAEKVYELVNTLRNELMNHKKWD